MKMGLVVKVQGKRKVLLKGESDVRIVLIARLDSYLDAMRKSTPDSREFNLADGYFNRAVHGLPADLRKEYEEKYRELTDSIPTNAPRVESEVIKR